MIKQSYLNLFRIEAFYKLFTAIRQKKEQLKTGFIILVNAVANKPINVLLADDDIDDRELFMEAIAEAKKQVSVKTVKDGEELMKTLGRLKLLPDIIFLDLNMPNKNGAQCLIEIRANKLLKHIPIVIYSTSSSVTDIETTYKNGATLYIKKPSTYSELKRITAKLFSLNISELIRQPHKDRFVFT